MNKKYLIEDKCEIVVQINGKKRSSFLIEKNAEEDKIKEYIKDNKLIEKYLNSGNLIKSIYIKNRLMNFIIK